MKTMRQVSEMDGRVAADKRGYALNVHCERGHTGNRCYVRAISGWWQCQGCLDFVAADVLLERQTCAAEARSYVVDGHRDTSFDLACGTAAALSVVRKKSVCVETLVGGRVVERLHVSTILEV